VGTHLGGDVAIVGAGLIGLAIAFELTEYGATVRVYERGEPGRAASWAGAGMLAPHTESIDDEAMLALCNASLAQYPAFVERVRAVSGVDSRLRLDGILRVSFDDASLEALRVRAQHLASLGVASDVLDRKETIEREPALGITARGALLVRGEGYVDNRRLGRALRAACEARGVIFMNDAQVVAVGCDSRRVLGVHTRMGFAPAAVVINAAGAWSANVEGVPASCAPPVTPVKGQMLALAVPQHFVRSTTWVRGAYLVPRDDGRLLVGATTEHVGFDERVTARGVHKLLKAVLTAAPALGEFTVTETWAGLRPQTPDERPILGVTPIDGLLLATGHYRNGILLTPETARLIATFVATGDAQGLEPFALARFADVSSSVSCPSTSSG
jgi:glycine oxidase